MTTLDFDNRDGPVIRFAPKNAQTYPQELWTTAPPEASSPTLTGPATNPVLCIAVPAPLARYFDYLPPPDASPNGLRAGVRVLVPFGRRQVIGILAGTATGSAVAQRKLRPAIRLLDTEPVLDDKLVALVSWAARDYHQAPGEVFAAALPSLLRSGRPVSEQLVSWRVTPAGREPDDAALARRAPRQAELLSLLQASPEGLGAGALGALEWDWRDTLRRLLRHGWVEQVQTEPVAEEGRPVATTRGPELTPRQLAAVGEIVGHAGQFGCYLLHGVTGSGKTEVYLRLAGETLARGLQALVLVPEIGLTPQLVERFRDRLGAPLAVMHSGLGDGERLAAWRQARNGTARVVIGTRSAVFTPLARPGLIIVDEEHDPSYRQQEGVRYSARDLAVYRARQYSVPVVLGSATPSLESLHNADLGRYHKLELPHRPGAARQPRVGVVDLRAQPSRHGLSTTLELAIERHLDAAGQVLLFLNRRGYATALFCAHCGWTAGCDRCDARMTLHRNAERLRCHHCGTERAIDPGCPECGAALKPVGQGTERVESYLAERFPSFQIARIDRDSVRRKGELEARLAEVRSGHTRILVGTQMLTKGHDFPDVTLVGILNADQGLFGTDLRSNERLAQTIIQVAGRAGRAARPGEVLIQTAFPAHPLLQRLIREGYQSFAEAALEERRDAGWPPFSSLALLRAEASQRTPPMQFLTRARQAAERLQATEVQLLGPAAAPMERRAGRYRAQLLLQAPTRRALQGLLADWAPELERLPGVRRVRWSLDVDPTELF